MRKFTFILPVSAILLAAVVLASDFGSPLSAQTPEAQPTALAKDADYDVIDETDVTATTWTETGIRNPDSRKPRLPQPKHAVKKAPKKKK